MVIKYNMTLNIGKTLAILGSFFFLKIKMCHEEIMNNFFSFGSKLLIRIINLMCKSFSIKLIC